MIHKALELKEDVVFTMTLPSLNSNHTFYSFNHYLHYLLFYGSSAQWQKKSFIYIFLNGYINIH